MAKQAKILSITVCSIILLLFILFVINQVSQVYQLASAYHPILGQAVLYTLTAIFLVLLFIPIWQFIKIPKRLVKPVEGDYKALDTYHKKLVARLRNNPELRDHQINWENEEEAIQRAIEIIDTKANKIIKDTAAITFVTTAVSQSGRLDGLMVLVNLCRMVWQIAHLYNQRPGLYELLLLYTNVAVTAFVVKEIEDLDIDEQVEPLVASIVTNYSLSVLPGSTYLTTLITTSLLNGSANAFLTLRVGILARKYSSPNEAFQKGVRRIATVEASKLLSTIIYDSSKHVTKSIINATKKTGAHLVEEGKQKVNQAYEKYVESIKDFNNKAIEKSKESLQQAKRESLNIMKSVYATLGGKSSEKDHK